MTQTHSCKLVIKVVTLLSFFSIKDNMVINTAKRVIEISTGKVLTLTKYEQNIDNLSNTQLMLILTLLNLFLLVDIEKQILLL